MKNAAVKIVAGINPPALPGIYHRILCMTGPNKGKCYYLNDKRAVLGRGNECDIQVVDIKTSREHAELVRVGSSYVITDLGSQNGIIVNDLNVKQHNLMDGDKIVIGQTMFKYAVLSVNRIDKVEEVEDDEEDVRPVNKKSEKKGNKNIIFLILGLLMVVIFFPTGKESVKEEKDKKTEGSGQASESFNDFISRKGTEDDEQLERRLDAIIHRGLREYREGNYFRAIEEFNLALILSPNNGRASFYLRRTRDTLNEDVEKNFIKAKQEVDALKYKSAIISYCSIVRLLQGYPDDERYKNAIQNIEFVEEKIGMKKGEIKCLEK